MRSMISALAFAALVLASSASAFDAQALQKHLDLKEKFQAMHAPMKAALNDFHAQAHGMNVQARTQIQDKSPKCVNTTRAIYSQWGAACGRDVIYPWFSDVPSPSDTDAQAEIDAFTAKTACINLFKQITAPANRSCFDGHTTTMYDFVLFLANPRIKGNDGATCGMQYMRFNRMFGGCQKYNSTLCRTAARTAVCTTRSVAELPDEQEWGSMAGGTKTPEPASVCTSAWDTASFAKICTGCFAKFLARGKDTMDSSSSFYSSFTTFAKHICGAKSPKGHLCYPLLMPKVAAAGGNPFSSATAMDGFCTGTAARELLPCVKRLFSSGASSDKVQAVREFKECWRGANTTARAGCMNAYKKAIYKVKQQTLQSKFLCSKNPAAANTQYCFTAHHKLHHNSNGCYNKARTGQSCSSCQAGLQTAVDGMGCCAGLIQTYYTAPRKLTKADYPRMHGFQPPADFTPDQIGSAPLRAAKAGEKLTTTSGTGYMALMANCGVTGLNETLRFMCGGARFKRAGKKLGLKIKFNSLNSTQKDTLKSAMKTDVANNLGLGEDEIVNDALVEDTSISVSGSTAGRVMELESANSGTQYTFDIEAEDDASATAASESFDSLAADDGFDLAETEYELDESVSTTAVSTSTTTSQYSDMATSAPGTSSSNTGSVPGSGSGASAPAQLLAALVILAVSLLAF